jgi:hypothetical protein
MLTLTNAYSVNVASPPQLVRLFLQIEASLLIGGQGELLARASSKNPVGAEAIGWRAGTPAVERFMFKTALDKLAGLADAETVDDALFGGELPCRTFSRPGFRCRTRWLGNAPQDRRSTSFRFFFSCRVELAKAIEKFKDYRRAVIQCDLLGPSEKIVSDLVVNHSFELGPGRSRLSRESPAATVTSEWLRCQYSQAATPAQVLEVHARNDAGGDPHFVIGLFARTPPYSRVLQVPHGYRTGRPSEGRHI